MENKTLQDFVMEVEANYEIPPLLLRQYKHLFIADIMEKAAELYAAHKAEQACRKQMELCAESVQMSFLDGHSKERTQLKYFQSGADNLTIDKASILNAPLASESK